MPIFLSYEEFFRNYFQKLNPKTGRIWDIEDIIDIHPDFDEELFRDYIRVAREYGL
jgi:hypothetical protein